MTAASQLGAFLRRRAAYTVVLVLIALGGAGLATAADRPATDRWRPELSYHTDSLAAPWLADLAAAARTVVSQVDATSDSGRTVLRLPAGADQTALADALTAGDASAAGLGPAASSLADLRGELPAGVDELKLSQANQALLAAVDDIVGAARQVPPAWQALAADARGGADQGVIAADLEVLEQARGQADQAALSLP
jgi:hypothetical protein